MKYMHTKTSRIVLFLVWITMGTSTRKTNGSCKPLNYRLHRATTIKCCVQAEPQNEELKQSCKAQSMKCKIWCAFHTTGIYVDRKLNTQNLESYLGTIYSNSTEMQAIARDTFIYCATEISKELQKLPMHNYPDGDCPPDATLLQFCVHIIIMTKCPAFIWQTTRECQELRDYMICREGQRDGIQKT